MNSDPNRCPHTVQKWPRLYWSPRNIGKLAAIIFAFAGLGTSPALARATLQQKLEQIDRTFICPESLASDEARKDALKLFIDQLFATQPDLTIRKIVNFRVTMLQKHRCNATLEKLGIAQGSPAQSGSSTIRAFYAALGAGQGVAASAMVVPEKRGMPAFSPVAMTRFYGGLKQPIRLIDISPSGGGSFVVHYHYGTSSRDCNGGAVVTTAIRDGNIFIQGIKVLNGC